jgi:hypothetical protein
VGVWGTGVIVSALLVVAVLPGGTRAQPSFYATAAQIIPVLILALAVDRVWREWSFKGRLLVVALLLMGEIAAMIGTAYDVHKKGHPGYLVASSRLLTDLLEFFAVASLGVGLIGVLLTRLFEPAATGAGERQSGGPPPVGY